jgi:hypothetical protein
MNSVTRVRLIGMRWTAWVTALAGAAAQRSVPPAGGSPDQIDWMKTFRGYPVPLFWQSRLLGPEAVKFARAIRTLLPDLKSCGEKPV